jgi:CRP/FNR family cyclic AMP-dependent transcriptional regulator
MQDDLMALRPHVSARGSRFWAALTPQEREAVERGRLFGRLPPHVREVILGRAYVWRLKDGEQVLPSDGVSDHWIGVASGELFGRTRLPDGGKLIGTQVLGPGAWLNMCSPLCDVSHRGIEFVAGGASCVLALSRRDTFDLAARWPELVMAMLSMSALDLRFAHLTLQEAQGCTLEQKVLRWVESSVCREGADAGDEAVYRSSVPQALLAAAAGVSRQTWNAGLAGLESAGLVQRLKDGLRVPDLQRLQAALRHSGLHPTSRYLQTGVQALPAAWAAPRELLPFSSLRWNERAALRTMRWHERLSEALRERVLAGMKVLRLDDGTPVAATHHQAPGWVAVVDGGLRVTSAAPDEALLPRLGEPVGRPSRAVIARLPAGATFFEYALIDRGECGVDVRSEGRTTLLLLEPEAFRGLVASEAEFALGVLKWMCVSHRQATRLRLTLSLPMAMRLPAWLDALAQQSGQRDGPWNFVPMRLSQADLGASLGTSRQYAGKAIHDLEKAGALERLPGGFRLRRESPHLAAMPDPS